MHVTKRVTGADQIRRDSICQLSAINMAANQPPQTGLTPVQYINIIVLSLYDMAM